MHLLIKSPLDSAIPCHTVACSLLTCWASRGYSLWTLGLKKGAGLQPSALSVLGPKAGAARCTGVVSCRSSKALLLKHVDSPGWYSLPLTLLPTTYQTKQCCDLPSCTQWPRNSDQAKLRYSLHQWGLCMHSCIPFNSRQECQAHKYADHETS
jgi:hypothetical protein